MALTFSKVRSGVMGDLRYWFGSITFDSSYPTGGEAITPADFGLRGEIFSVVLGHSDEAGIDPRWDRANSKIILWDEDNTSGIEAQFGNGTDASGVVLDGVTVFGL